MRGKNHGVCLAEETLTDYLEGTLDPAIKAASETHLVGCDECRNQLTLLMRILQPEITPDEARTLEVISAKWDRAKDPAVTIPPKLGISRRLILPSVIAAVVLLGVLSVWVMRQQSSTLQSPAEVVQLLLEQSRPFESRMAGQPHLPIVRTRGAEDPKVSYPLLAGELTRRLATAHEMGRFYLLQKDFDRALPYLEMAQQEVGAGPSVHNDLGVAYLEAGNPSQLQKAGAEFRTALQMDSSFVAAVFNLALFYERTNATAQAEAQWKRYLELDSTSAWADEARERLRGISR